MQNNLLGLALLTYIVEYAVYAALLWRLGHRTWLHIVLFVFLVNGLTWPMATVMYHIYSLHILFIELGVVFVEALVIRFWWRPSWAYALLLSMLANGLSYVVGLAYYS